MRRLLLIGSPIAGAGLAVLLVACSRADMTPVPDWVECTVEEVADLDTATMVSNVARVLEVERGHTLRIPANAAPAGTRIRFTQETGSRVRVRVTPANLVLDSAVTLTLVYAGRDCEIEDTSALAIFRLGNNNKLPRPKSVSPDSSVAGLAERFSLFAIAR